MKEMSKRARLEATIAGEPVDRPAVALWRHWPADDQHAERLVDATLYWQRTLDFDFIKAMPASNYCVADWGAESRYAGDQEGTRVWGRRVIQEPNDWAELRPLDPDKGRLGEMGQFLHLLGKELEGQVPFIQTIFSPLAQAKNLAGGRLLADLRHHPARLKGALETITETTVGFIKAIKNTGAAGIFLALQHATVDLLSEHEYQEFGRPYDLRILEATKGMWFNLLHLHGTNVMFDLVADYPVQAVNWHDRETAPSLPEALVRFPGALVGGLQRWETMVCGTAEQVRDLVWATLEETGGQRVIIGTGCVTPVSAPLGNVRAAREAVETAPR
jgi:uroporphyrinogen decarboxylase